MSGEGSSGNNFPKRIKLSGANSFYYTGNNDEIIFSDEEINAAISSVPIEVETVEQNTFCKCTQYL